MKRFVRVPGASAATAATLIALLSASGAARAAPTTVPPLPASGGPASQTITTLLGEVGRGAVDGREFLTLQVGRAVGPAACRGDVLRVDTLELGDAAQRDRIETAALSAMLGDQVVSVTVPLDATRCTDGKPAFSDVRPLPPGR